MSDQPPEPQSSASPQPHASSTPPSAAPEQPVSQPSPEVASKGEPPSVEVKLPVFEAKTEPPTGQESKAEPKPDQKAPESGKVEPPVVKPEISRDELRSKLDIRGNNNITAFIERLGKADEKTVLDFLVQLPIQPLTDPGIAVFADTDLDARHSTLTVDRCLLVSCSDRPLGRTAGYALVNRLGIGQDRRWLLNFERLPETSSPDIYQLLNRRIDGDGEVVLLVDATSNNGRAQKFVDSLYAIDGAFAQSEIHESFVQQKLTVICYVDPQKLRPETLPFPVWSISYLQHILRPRYPDDYLDYEAKLLRQRQAARWSSSDHEFYKQVLEALDAGTLLERLTDERLVVPPAAPDAALSDQEKPLRLPVLYTATFYPNLPPNEFSRVLTTFLGDRRTLVPETIEHRTKDGGVKEVTLRREKQLAKIWADGKDAILEECGLVTSRETNRVVTFAETGRRDRMRQLFEEKYGSYAQVQFETAWEKELLLDPSDRVAADLQVLTLDMAASYPDQHGRDWLFGVLERFCKGPHDRSLVLRRLCDLMREMLGKPPLDAAVAGLLERLIQTAQHDVAFEIVRNLRYAPHFDELHWLKQLIDRGSEEVRTEATSYLFHELLRLGIGAYRLMHQLEKWLPAPERAPSTYSPSHHAALFVLLVFCTETTRRFEVEHYGEWPTTFPLLAVDRDSAKSDFALLVKLMFHPGVASVVDAEWSLEQAIGLTLSLISEWVFILFGSASESSRATETSDLTPDLVLDLLLEQILLATKHAEDKAVRRTMLEAWENTKDLYALAPVMLGDEGFRRRKEFVWKRNLIRKILTEFRRLERQARG